MVLVKIGNSFDYNRWSLDPEGILDYIHESRLGIGLINSKLYE